MQWTGTNYRGTPRVGKFGIRPGAIADSAQIRHLTLPCITLHVSIDCIDPLQNCQRARKASFMRGNLGPANFIHSRGHVDPTYELIVYGRTLHRHYTLKLESCDPFHGTHWLLWNAWSPGRPSDVRTVQTA